YFKLIIYLEKSQNNLTIYITTVTIKNTINHIYRGGMMKRSILIAMILILLSGCGLFKKSDANDTNNVDNVNDNVTEENNNNENNMNNNNDIEKDEEKKK